MEDGVNLSDRTSVGMPIRNLIGLIGTVCVGAWGYFGILERLNVVAVSYTHLTLPTNREV